MPKKKKRKYNIEKINKPVEQTIQEYGDLKSDLQSGVHQPFWVSLKRVIEENVSYLSKQIENNVDNLTDQQLRLMVKWRNINRELITLPESLINSLELQDRNIKSVTDLDPYYKTYKEIVQDERTR